MLKENKKRCQFHSSHGFSTVKKKVTHSSYYTEAITRHLLRLVLFPEKEIDFNHLLFKKGKKKRFANVAGQPIHSSNGKSTLIITTTCIYQKINNKTGLWITNKKRTTFKSLLLLLYHCWYSGSTGCVWLFCIRIPFGNSFLHAQGESRYYNKQNKNITHT